MPKTNQLPKFDYQGILRCAQYAFMPNRLNFCGPDKNKDLFHYCHSQKVDLGLNLILKEFQVLYPYLKLIGRANQIKDAFNEGIVEAYWIGSPLLDNVGKSRFYNHLTDEQQLKRKLNKKLLKKVIDKIPLGAKPHHNFHVLSVWKRTGNLNVMHTLSSMDLCRISWGRVKKVNQTDLEAEYSPLVLENDKLSLGEPVVTKVDYRINNKGFIQNPRENNWVSMHWGFACEILTDSQVVNLRRYTQESIDLVNT